MPSVASSGKRIGNIAEKGQYFRIYNVAEYFENINFCRAVPSTMVRPIILGAAASSNLLDGMKNQIRCGLHP